MGNLFHKTNRPTKSLVTTFRHFMLSLHRIAESVIARIMVKADPASNLDGHM